MENGRHWVLVVLLLGNVVHPAWSRIHICIHACVGQIINESLPIFLDSAIGGGSTTAIGDLLLPSFPFCQALSQ
ncbi:hypothetical protein B0H10DRAFT_2026333 [Mycena sp. CBHHK59/15]|nr:hypothetical protein B0H10DRAFT_2026333 [Mycena sp. CBHHK59/15]